MKKIINIAFLALALVGTVGCYSKFDNPPKAYEYSDADFDNSQIISIYDFKNNYKALVGTSKSNVIEDDLVIRGKVISCDQEGNVYKSLFILDHTGEKSAAIELRLYAGNYVKYPVGTIVYVRLKGLAIGDYRGMLSVGYLIEDREDPTKNKYTNIDSRLMLKDHILMGECQNMEKRDTVVVYKDVVKDTERGVLYTDLSDDNYEYRGRLVRFEGVESVHGTAKWGNRDTYPNYFASGSDRFVWTEEIGQQIEALAIPTLAYYGQAPGKSSLVRYYGSSWYSYEPKGENNKQGQYVIRASAYARFRETKIPANGSKVNITAIYTCFSSYDSKYNVYQITPSYGSDIQVVE